MELSTMITGAQQQRNATATQFDSSDFFVRRPEECEGTLIILTARIEESYTQEINLRRYLHQHLDRASISMYRTSFNKIEHPLVLPNIFYLCRTSFSFLGHL